MSVEEHKAKTRILLALFTIDSLWLAQRVLKKSNHL